MTVIAGVAVLTLGGISGIAHSEENTSRSGHISMIFHNWEPAQKTDRFRMGTDQYGETRIHNHKSRVEKKEEKVGSRRVVMMEDTDPRRASLRLKKNPTASIK